MQRELMASPRVAKVHMRKYFPMTTVMPLFIMSGLEPQVNYWWPGSSFRPVHNAMGLSSWLIKCLDDDLMVQPFQVCWPASYWLPLQVLLFFTLFVSRICSKKQQFTVILIIITIMRLMMVLMMIWTITITVSDYDDDNVVDFDICDMPILMVIWMMKVWWWCYYKQRLMSMIMIMMVMLMMMTMMMAWLFSAGTWPVSRVRTRSTTWRRHSSLLWLWTPKRLAGSYHWNQSLVQL